MTPQVVLVIVAVTVTNVGVGCLWLGWPPWVGDRIRRIAARPAVAVSLVPVALGLIWIGIFLVGRFPISGDVALFYRPQGRSALAGAIPNVDFTSLYMPGFVYLMGLVDFVWSNDLSIPLFLAIIFAATSILMPRLLQSTGIHPATSIVLTIAGMLNGASWVLAVGYQQDESLLLLASVVAMLMMIQGKDGWAGVVLGIGLVCTKILFLLTLAALMMQARRPWRTALGAVLGGAPLLVVLFLHGFDPWRMVGGGVGAWVPPSLVTLAGVLPASYRFFGAHVWIPHAAVGVLCLGLCFYFSRRGGSGGARGMMRSVVAVWLGYVLLSPNSVPAYRVVLLPFLPALLDDHGQGGRRRVILFCFYCTSLGIQWMLYEDGIDMPYATFLERNAFSAGSMARAGGQLILDVTTNACELFWLAVCFAQARRLTAGKAVG